MAEYNVNSVLADYIKQYGDQENPAHVAIGNMETARLKEEETRALFMELLEYKKLKDTNKIPMGFQVPVEVMEGLHKNVAPHLSQEEFSEVANVFKGVFGNNNQGQEKPETARPSKPTDFSNMGDMVIAALGAMGRNNPENYGEQLRSAVESKQKQGMLAYENQKELEAKTASAEATLAEKKEAREQKAWETAQALQQKLEIAMQQSEDKRYVADLMGQLKLANMNMMASLRRSEMELKLLMSKAALGKGKIVSPPVVKDWNTKKNAIDQYKALLKDFKPEYANYYFGGKLVTRIKQRTGSDTDRVNWWKNFKRLDAELRHELFGATLTTNEQKAWDDITINENTDSNIVTSNILLRSNIATDNLRNDVDGYLTAGYDIGNYAPPERTEKTGVEIVNKPKASPVKQKPIMGKSPGGKFIIERVD